MIMISLSSKCKTGPPVAESDSSGEQLSQRKPDQAKYVPPGRRAQLIRQAEEADERRRRLEADEQRRRREARREAAERDKWVRRRPTASAAPDIGSLSLAPTTKTAAIDSGRLGHLMELYDFATDLHVDNVAHALRRFGQPRVHFVDDGHLLAAFASASEAELAAADPPDCMRMRPVSKASPAVAAWLSAAAAASTASTQTAADPDVLAPAKRRPETDAGTARRFIIGHLGSQRAGGRNDSAGSWRQSSRGQQA